MNDLGTDLEYPKVCGIVIKDPCPHCGESALVSYFGRFSQAESSCRYMCEKCHWVQGLGMVKVTVAGMGYFGQSETYGT